MRPLGTLTLAGSSGAEADRLVRAELLARPGTIRHAEADALADRIIFSSPLAEHYYFAAADVLADLAGKGSDGYARTLALLRLEQACAAVPADWDRADEDRAEQMAAAGRAEDAWPLRGAA